MKKIISGLCAAISVLALLSFSSCEEPLKVSEPFDLKTRIIVDEETLVQYIFYGNGNGLDSRTASLTVRLKEDGTPCTINREDLDKYTHFSFNKKANSITEPFDLKTRIIVDEETLVQYIFYGNGNGLDSRVASLTVRLKEDGTPCTIECEDLNKYTHFSFNKKENE